MAIIPVYNASQLFGNIDVIVKVNEAFLADLERVLGSEAEEQVGAEWGVGDVALKHVCLFFFHPPFFPFFGTRLDGRGLVYFYVILFIW